MKTHRGIITHRCDNELKRGKCHICGVVATCNPEFDFYDVRGFESDGAYSPTDKPLKCEKCAYKIVLKCQK